MCFFGGPIKGFYKGLAAFCGLEFTGFSQPGLQGPIHGLTVDGQNPALPIIRYTIIPIV